MKKNNKLVRSTLASAVLLAISCHVWAKAGCEEPMAPPASTEEQHGVVDVPAVVIPETQVPVEPVACDEPTVPAVVAERSQEVVEVPMVAIPEPQAPVEPVDCDEPTILPVVVDAQHEAVQVPEVIIPEPPVPAEPVVVPEAPLEVDEPMFTELSDKLHQITQTLTNTASVHHYSFVSVRGQDVLLGTLERTTFNKLWKLEYQVNGGQWKLKQHTTSDAHRGLEPGSVVNVRISAVEGAKFENAPYKVVLGSYPHMSYDLHHEEGLLRFPRDFSKPGFIATQAMEKALLEARFWDSKNTPLEGGVMVFKFQHHGPVSLDPIILISGSNGKATRLLEFGKCEGGEAAKSFIENQPEGRATWGTRYKQGSYVAYNAMLENLADTPHTFNFAHVCRRFLMDWQIKL